MRQASAEPSQAEALTAGACPEPRVSLYICCYLEVPRSQSMDSMPFPRLKVRWDQGREVWGKEATLDINMEG